MNSKNFGDMLLALLDGRMVRRTSWPIGTFVFRQVPATIEKDIVPKMQSLPTSVKEEFDRRFKDEAKQIDAIYYDCQFAIVNSSNLILSYSPSVEDTLAPDWIVI